MRILEGLQPAPVFRYFEQICAIPHGSGNTQALAEYCLAFAAARGLTAWQDRGGNVVIRKGASPGYEDAEPVILQGHLDMVCEKTADCAIDMAKDALRLQVDGDWIRAEGTTLGGDNGIAVAMALAVLDDDTLCHPELEVLLTTDEEVGLLGAAALEPENIRGRRLLNLDSECEGVFTVSCAGGSATTCILPLESEACDGTTVKLKIEGLTGGHSGVEIHHGRGNACILMGRLLEQLDCRVIRLHNGGKDNAIARRAEATVCVRGNWEPVVAGLEQQFRRQFADTDPNLRVTARVEAQEHTALTAACTAGCIAFLRRVPNGIVAMSKSIPGLVQTSLNLGILEADLERFRASFSVRSSVGEEKAQLNRELKALTESLGGYVEISGDYPAWEYREDSPLRELAVDVYTRQYGKPPVVEAIHAGLECGLLAGKLPGLDAISYGPQMHDIHTPMERLSISSVERVWHMTLELLKACR